MSAAARAERDVLERSPAPIEKGPVAVISMGGRGAVVLAADVAGVRTRMSATGTLVFGLHSFPL